jgi:hypothetical protein
MQEDRERPLSTHSVIRQKPLEKISELLPATYAYRFAIERQ